VNDYCTFTLAFSLLPVAGGTILTCALIGRQQRRNSFLLPQAGCHAHACVGMCAATDKNATWPNKFGHGTPDSPVSATETNSDVRVAIRSGVRAAVFPIAVTYWTLWTIAVPAYVLLDGEARLIGSVLLLAGIYGLFTCLFCLPTFLGIVERLVCNAGPTAARIPVPGSGGPDSLLSGRRSRKRTT
jgi:hypothetical protein